METSETGTVQRRTPDRAVYGSALVVWLLLAGLLNTAAVLTGEPGVLVGLPIWTAIIVCEADKRRRDKKRGC